MAFWGTNEVKYIYDTLFHFHLHRQITTRSAITAPCVAPTVTNRLSYCLRLALVLTSLIRRLGESILVIMWGGQVASAITEARSGVASVRRAGAFAERKTASLGFRSIIFLNATRNFIKQRFKYLPYLSLKL